METTKIMPCPCGGDGLIKPMPDLKPITFELANPFGAAGNFGITFLEDFSTYGAITKISAPAKVNNDANLVQPTLDMLAFFPIKISQINIETTRVSQFYTNLQYGVVNYEGKFNVKEIDIAASISNTQANPLLRTINADFVLKQNCSLYIMVPAHTRTWLTITPSLITTT
jgi:hypothetical protein